MSKVVNFYKTLYKKGKINETYLNSKVNLDTSSNGKKNKSDKTAALGKITEAEKIEIMRE
jgi:hypothetical protein